jgi:hypothetical protein
MKKVFLAITLSISSLSIYAWETNKCPKDQAACFIISDEQRPIPPKNLDSGRVVFGFGDGDGCLASAPVFTDVKSKNLLKANPGIKVSGTRNGHCAYNDQLDKAYITYNEKKSVTNDNYTARIFAIYTVKDQVAAGPLQHRHDLEHAILWLENGVPKYMSVSEHKGVKTRLISEVPSLSNNRNAFAAKYIQTGSSHYLVFADGEKDDKGNLIPKNKKPTPTNAWFGEDHKSFVDFNEAVPRFKDLMTNRVFGDAVPRLNDIGYLNEHKPKQWKEISF